MQALKDIMANYNTVDNNGIKITRVKKDLGLPDHRAIFETLPEMFEQWVSEPSRTANIRYKIKASIGQGNKAEIPWICIYNTAITRSVESGYYIGLLFAADMQRVYLTLNQCVTKNTLEDTELFVTKALEYLGTQHPHQDNLVYRKIDLSSKGKLGKRYELAAIKSYAYNLGQLPTVEEFRRDFLSLLTDYNHLFFNAGGQLENLPALTEATFQQDIQRPVDEDLKIPEGGLNVPSFTSQISKGFVRLAKYSRKALKDANYTCEVDPTHLTFKSRGGHNFMEGHHLVPMSQQYKYQYSLDLPENIVCLCPTCHRALHHGNTEKVKTLLKHLHPLKYRGLNSRQLNVSLEELQKIYIEGLLENNID